MIRLLCNNPLCCEFFKQKSQKPTTKNMFDDVAFNVDELIVEACTNKNKGGNKIGSQSGVQKPHTVGEYEDLSNQMFPAQIYCFSGCQDTQTSADVYDVTTFGLPQVSGA